MDGLLNSAKNAMGGSSNQQAAPQGGAAAPGGQQAPAGQKDYGDKAFGAAEKKAGFNLNDQQSEQITDGARGLYEKATGNKVDPKYSN